VAIRCVLRNNNVSLSAADDRLKFKQNSIEWRKLLSAQDMLAKMAANEIEIHAHTIQRRALKRNWGRNNPLNVRRL